jgi:four helix bundle protein
VLVLGGDIAEHRFAHRIELPICVKEPHNPLRLLKRLDQAVPQDPIDAPVREANAIVVMLGEGVPRYLQDVQPGRVPSGRLYGPSFMQDYHQLDIWHRAMAYAVEIDRFSAQLPDTERYNLTAQLRTAAPSVPLNIAAGAGCTTNSEFARVLGYASRSLKEVVTCLELCQRLYPALPVQRGLDVLIDEGNQISRMTHSLMQRLDQPPGAPAADDS